MPESAMFSVRHGFGVKLRNGMGTVSLLIKNPGIYLNPPEIFQYDFIKSTEIHFLFTFLNS